MLIGSAPCLHGLHRARPSARTCIPFSSRDWPSSTTGSPASRPLVTSSGGRDPLPESAGVRPSSRASQRKRTARSARAAPPAPGSSPPIARSAAATGRRRTGRATACPPGSGITAFSLIVPVAVSMALSGVSSVPEASFVCVVCSTRRRLRACGWSSHSGSVAGRPAAG